MNLRMSCLSARVASVALVIFTFFTGVAGVVQAQSADTVPPSDPKHSPFVSAPSVPLAYAPSGIAIGDLDRDGKLNLVTADAVSGKVTVFPSLGNAKFGTGVEYVTAGHPTSVTIADLNGDGRSEVVLCDEAQGTIRILSGTGSGHLQLKQSYNAGLNPAFVVTGDFNGDGKVDIAVASRSQNSLAVLINDGKGNLEKPIVLATHGLPTALAGGDFNNDERSDLAVAHADGTLTIYLGSGNGSFRMLPAIDTGSGPLNSILAGDFDRDGKVDLAVTQSGGKSILILSGKGNGSFAEPVPYAVGSNPVAALLADVDEDGIPDLIVTNQGSNSFSVLGGRGDGSFREEQSFMVGKGPLQSVAGDFDGDGHVDLAVINAFSRSVSIATGNGDGTFKAARAYTTELQPRSVASADLNGDQRPDLVVTNYCGSDASCRKGGSVAVFLANESGGYRLSSTYALGTGPISVAIVDVDGDKRPDIVALNRGDKTVSVLLSKGEGSFESALTYSLIDAPLALAVGDFNRDGNADLAVLEDCGAAKCSQPGSLEVLLGQGDGGFHSAQSYAVGFSPTSIAVGDLNNDRKLDILVSNGCGKDSSCKSIGTATVLLGAANGKFTVSPEIALGKMPSTIVLADMSNHGSLDMVVSRSGDNAIAVLRGNGDGSFQSPVAYKAGNAPGSIAVADFNGDGRADVAVTNTADATVSILYGNSDGSLQTPFTLPVGNGPESLLAIPGSNGAGASLVTANANAGPLQPGEDMTVLANVQPEVGTVTPTITLTPPASPSTVNEAVTLSVVVSGSQVPTGKVTFQSNGVSIVDCGNPVTLNQAGKATCTTKTLSAGTDALTVSYSGDTVYAAATSSPVSQTVDAVAATLALKSSSATINVGDSVTFTATLTASPISPLAPSGTISFTINGSASADCPAKKLNGTTSATCKTSSLAGGSDTIAATYTGDPNFIVANGATLPVTVAAIPATLTLTPASTTISVDDSVSFTATVTPSVATAIAPAGTVSFTINGNASTDCPAKKLVGTNSAICKTSKLAAGTSTIAASYANDPNFTVNGTQSSTAIVNALASTVSVTSVPATTATVGQSVTFTAALVATSISPVAPTGTMTFTINGASSTDCPPQKVNPTTGAAKCTTQSLITPADIIQATYSGDSNYTASLPGSETIAIGTTTGQTTLSASPATASVNSPVTFKAVVAPPGSTKTPATGSVTFYQGSAVLCSKVALSTPPATAVCTYAFTAITDNTNSTITAVYSGDSNYTAGAPGTVTETIVADTVTTQVVSNQPASSVNQTVTFSATLTPTVVGKAFPTAGTVVYADATVSPAITLCSNPISASGVVPPCSHTFTSAGNRTITATFTSNDKNFIGSGSGKVTQSVGASGTTITVTSSPATVSTNQSVTFSSVIAAATTGSAVPQGVVTYADGLTASTLCKVFVASDGTVPNCTVPLTVAGTHTITAKFATTDNNFQSATSAVLNEVVTAGVATVTLSASPKTSVVDQPVSFTATVTPPNAGAANPTGTVTFSYNQSGTTIVLCSKPVKLITSGSSTTAACQAPITAAGTFNVTANFITGDTNFTAGPAAVQPQVVGPASTTVAVSPTSPNPSSVNQSVNFTAVVTPSQNDSNLTLPSGTVTFYEAGSVMLCVANLAADGTVTPCPAVLGTAGAHSITAVYSGDANFSASPTSPALTQMVNPTSTTTAVTSSLLASTATQTVTYTATATPTIPGTPLSGAITFVIAQGATTYSCTEAVIPPAKPSDPYAASCTITYPANVSGSVSVSAVYGSDKNYATSTSPAITQTVANFTPAVTPTSVLLTQGDTNNTDPFNKSTIALSSSALSGFNDPLSVTACNVISPAGGPTTDVTCTPAGAVNNGGGSIASITLAATGAAQLGVYKVQLTVSDVNLPALSKQVSIDVVSVLYQSVQLQTPSVGTVVATFDLANPLPSTSTLSCADVRVDNGDGTYGPAVGLQDIGIACSAITPGTGTNVYTFTITAGKPTTAQLLTTSKIVTATLVAMPLMLLASLLPGVRRRRKSLLRYLAMVVLALGAMHTIGCGSGGFTRVNPVVAVSGSYVIEIQEKPKTGNGTTVAVIPLLIGH